MRNLIFALSLSLSLALPAQLALAGPLVKGGKPGAAVSWKSDGAAVVFKLASGYDASEVAKTIQAKVQGVTAKAAGDAVSVSGMPEAKLIAALDGVDVGEPAGGDDVDGLLANLREGDKDEDASGSSIRATKASDFSEVMGKKDELITAKVIDVKRQKFPLV